LKQLTPETLLVEFLTTTNAGEMTELESQFETVRHHLSILLKKQRAEFPRLYLVDDLSLGRGLGSHASLEVWQSNSRAVVYFHLVFDCRWLKSYFGNVLME